MKKLLLSIALITLLNSNAQNKKQEKISESGVQTTISRTTESYDKISTSGSFAIELVANKEGNITIKGDENIINHIITEVNGDELKVYFEKNISCKYKGNVTITIPFEEISGFSSTGSGKIITKDTIKADKFELKFTGSGEGLLDLNTKNSIVQMSGSGTINLSGTTEELEGRVSGSGDLNCTKLIATNAEVNVAGSGSTEVNCKNKLIANVSGSGNIQYLGKPKSIDKKVTGSGDISSF